MSSAGPPGFPPNIPPSPPPYPPQGFYPPQAPLPPAKKSNALIWILGIVVVMVMGVLATCGIGAYLVMRKAKESGLDGALLSKNPAYAMAKLAATANKDVDIVSTDDGSGTIKVRDKKTGETTTLRFDAATKRMVVTNGDGKQATVSITGDGDKTALNIQSPDGAVNFSAGASNQMPAWVPVYPGSTPKGTFSAQGKGASQSAFGFTTADPAAKVIEYYQDQLKAGGFTVTQTFASAAGGLITAENGKRSLTVTVSGSGNETSATLLAAEKQ
jgi:hypothetical protein